MERLTERVLGFAQIKECGNDFCKETCEEHDEDKGCNKCPIQRAIEKLTQYEDLEEECIKENAFGLRMLLKKWNEFFEDIKELYEYRELEKKGRLLKLPCEIGGAVYCVRESWSGYVIDKKKFKSGMI